MNSAWRTANAWAVDVAERRDVRVTSNVPVEECNMASLKVWTQRYLRTVAARGVDVESLVQMSGPAGGERVLVCGDRDGPSFERCDGVRCHFKIVVRESRGQLETISYVMHVDAPTGRAASPSFLRWECAPTRKSGVDALKEPLSHLHPGHDHVRLPSPVLSPKELIVVFLGLELWG